MLPAWIHTTNGEGGAYTFTAAAGYVAGVKADSLSFYIPSFHYAPDDRDHHPALIVGASPNAEVFGPVCLARVHAPRGTVAHMVWSGDGA
jgi:hypothetical protein